MYQKQEIHYNFQENEQNNPYPEIEDIYQENGTYFDYSKNASHNHLNDHNDFKQQTFQQSKGLMSSQDPTIQGEYSTNYSFCPIIQSQYQYDENNKGDFELNFYGQLFNSDNESLHSKQFRSYPYLSPRKDDLRNQEEFPDNRNNHHINPPIIYQSQFPAQMPSSCQQIQYTQIFYNIDCDTEKNQSVPQQYDQDQFLDFLKQDQEQKHQENINDNNTFNDYNANLVEHSASNATSQSSLRQKTKAPRRQKTKAPRQQKTQVTRRSRKAQLTQPEEIKKTQEESKNIINFLMNRIKNKFEPIWRQKLKLPLKLCGLTKFTKKIVALKHNDKIDFATKIKDYFYNEFLLEIFPTSKYIKNQEIYPKYIEAFFSFLDYYTTVYEDTQGPKKTVSIKQFLNNMPGSISPENLEEQ